MTYFLLRQNYVIYLLNLIMFFDEVGIMLYFGTFELRMDTLQLRFTFVHHRDEFCIA